MFFIPDGVDELVYSEEPTLTAEEIDDDFTTELTTGEADIDSVEMSATEVDYAEVPETPQILGVESPQTIRMDATGNEVVDAVLDVDDTYGVVQYEIRLTKI